MIYIKRAAIAVFFVFGIGLMQTCDSRDPYLQPQPKQILPRQLTAEEVEQLNQLGGHDADEDIRWTYAKP